LEKKGKGEKTTILFFLIFKNSGEGKEKRKSHASGGQTSQQTKLYRAKLLEDKKFTLKRRSVHREQQNFRPSGLGAEDILLKKKKTISRAE